MDLLNFVFPLLDVGLALVHSFFTVLWEWECVLCDTAFGSNLPLFVET